MSSSPDPTLHPDDAVALDRLVDAEYEPAAADADARMAQVSAVLSRLDALPAEQPSADLTDRTLARIQQAIDAEVRGHRLTPADRSWWTSAMRSIGAMAAVVALGLLAVWPVLSDRELPSDISSPDVITAGAGPSIPSLFSREESLSPAETQIPVVRLEGLQGYTGPVTIQPRWVERQVTQPDGAVVRVWQPVLVIVPLDPELRSSQD
jgi:hypothetical protein